MEGAVPAGTLTLLSSDIEGSTSALRALGADYPSVLPTRRSILRGAFERWHGREMGTEGDSFFLVFSPPLEAVEELLDVSLLTAEKRPDGEPRFRLLRTISGLARRWLTEAGATGMRAASTRGAR